MSPKKIIKSKENKIFKFLKSLINSHTRKKQKAFLLEGFVFVKEAIQNNAPVILIGIGEELEKTEKAKEIIKLAKSKNILVYIFSDNLIKEISYTEAPQGIISAIKQPEKFKKEEVFQAKANTILILESIQDPSNVGAIIRVADAAGVKAIFYTKGTADPYTPKAVRSSAGSILHLPVLPVESIKEIILQLKKENFQIIGTVAENGINLFEVNFSDKVALILGNEAKGLSKEAKNLADKNLTIPVFGKAQSLNVAVATGIILYEILHQRFYIVKP